MTLGLTTRRTIIASVVMGGFSSACGAPPIGPPHEGRDSEEGRRRRSRSEAALSEEHVPILTSLPVLDPVALTRFRTTEETVDRALCLAYVAVLAETEDRTLVHQFFGNWDAQSRFSPEESAFVAAAAHTPEDRSKFSWRYESFAVLAWVLGHWDSLGRPDHQVDVAALMGNLGDLGLEGFRSRARMRRGEEIVDLLDLTYRYDWAAVDARANGRSTPAGLSEDVIVERHTALNWVTSYLNQDWDDVRTDT